MKKRTEAAVVAVLITVMLIATGIAEATAVSSSCNCEVYNTRPLSMTVAKGKSKSVKKVYRYSFRIKNAQTFSSFKNIIKGLSGKSLKATSFKWVSADRSIASVNSKGKVTGIKKGTTYIYPIRNTVCSYSTRKSFVLYTDVNLVNGLKISGAFAMKVTVK